MPSYEFSKEIVSNLWLGTKNALRDADFRKRHHIIRDIIVESSFTSPVEPIETSNAARVVRVTMNGDENQLEIQTICNKVFPVLDEALEKDRGVLISGESWNSPQLRILALWCTKRTELSLETVMRHIQSYL
jgi:hypothetical protein